MQKIFKIQANSRRVSGKIFAKHKALCNPKIFWRNHVKHIAINTSYILRKDLIPNNDYTQKIRKINFLFFNEMKHTKITFVKVSQKTSCLLGFNL